MNGVKKLNNSNIGVSITGSPENGHIVTLDYTDALRDLFNTTDGAQAEALLSHCLKILKNDEADDALVGNDERAFVLSIIGDLEPRDAVERMLAVQMAATHVAIVRSGRWLAFSEQTPQAQVHYTGFNKLLGTFSKQVETLRKYRNGGEQKVTVQHVNVSEGGQAIVGNIQTKGGGGK